VGSLGIEMNGIYQPIWALTMTYLTLVLSSMSAYSYPRLCELTTLRDITEELNGILRIALLLITPAMFLLLMARRPIIHILYSSNFLPATEYMPVQILGDFFKVLFWAMGMYLLPTKRLLGFIWLNLLQDILLVILAAALVTRYQLHGIAVSFALSYLIAFLALYVYSKKQIGLSMWVVNRKLLSASFGTLVAIILSEKYLSFWPSTGVACLAVFSWGLLSIRKDELLKLKDYISEKLSKTTDLSESNSL
jgi:PST family polysaccharide transporter